MHRVKNQPEQSEIELLRACWTQYDGRMARLLGGEAAVRQTPLTIAQARILPCDSSLPPLHAKFHIVPFLPDAKS